MGKDCVSRGLISENVQANTEKQKLQAEATAYLKQLEAKN
jgi:hypothetical protein